MKRIRPLPMCEWEEQDLEHVFTNLQVVEGKKSRPNDSSKEQRSRPTNDPVILGRIFKVTPPERNICLIEGPAGIGKSTLCRQFAYLWSKDGYKIHGHHFDFVGILEARSLTKDFQTSFVEDLFPEKFQIPEKNICQHFETGKSLLIIDGLDELTADGECAITQLLEGRFFRDVHLIITGRPESVKKFLPYAKLHLEVKGFSERNAEEYIHKYFRNDENNHKMKLLDRLKCDRELRKLMVNPFVTVLLCILVQEKSGGIPSNLMEIYCEVMWTICRKYMKKLQEQGDCSVDEKMLYNAACYLAYRGVRDKVFVFPENYINSLCEGNLGLHLVKSGILSKDYTISRLHSNEFCYFPHRSFQEFFCGTYLEELDLNEFKKKTWPLLSYSPVDPLNPTTLACLRYSMGTQVNKTKIVLEHLFEMIDHGTKTIIYNLGNWFTMPLRFLIQSIPRLDLVDFFRIHFNRSFKVAVAIYIVVQSVFSHGPLNDQVHLAIYKMDLPPVVHFWDMHTTYRTDQLKSWVHIAVTSNVILGYFRTNIRLLEHFTKSNGVKMPFILCSDIRHASTCLKNLRKLGVLAIYLASNAPNYFHLKAFQQDLTSVENKINIVFVFLEARYDDSRSPRFISLMKGYSSDKVKIQVITLKPVDVSNEDLKMSLESSQSGSNQEDPDTDEEDVDYFSSIHCRVHLNFHYVINETTEYRLSRPPHLECYDRFCPY